MPLDESSDAEVCSAHTHHFDERSWARRLKLFSGRKTFGGGELEYDSWEYHVQQLIQEDGIDEQLKKRLVLQSLIQPALGLVRSVGASATLAQISDVLRVIYGPPADSHSLLMNFYDAIQGHDEISSDYLQRLQRKLRRIVDSDEQMVDNEFKMLVKQFERGCRNDSLLISLKTDSLLNDGSFCKLLANVRRFEVGINEKAARLGRATGAISKVGAGKSSVTGQACAKTADVSDVDKLNHVFKNALEMHTKTVLDAVKRDPVSIRTNAQIRSGSPQQEVVDDNRRTHRFSGFCYRCGLNNHMAFECRGLKNAELVQERLLQRNYHQQRQHQSKNYRADKSDQRGDSKITFRNSQSQMRNSDAVGHSDILSQLIGKRCECDVIIGGIETTGLVDTGSQVSMVTVDFYRTYLSDIPLNTLSDIVNIEGANGQSIPYHGYIKIDVSLPEQPDGVGSPQSLLFICNSTNYSKSVPVLLGTNVLRKLRDSNGKSLPSARLSKMYESVSEREDVCQSGGVLGEVHVVGKRGIVVEPNETITVNGIGHLNRAFRSGPCPAIIDAPSEVNPLPGGLCIKTALVTMSGVHNDKVKVPVFNPTCRAITIPPGSIIGSLCLPKWIRPIGGEGNGAKATCHKITTSHKKAASDKLFESCLDESELPIGWKNHVLHWLEANDDIFSMHKLDFGKTDAAQHRIHLTSDLPFKERSRPIPPRDLEDAQTHIMELLDAGIIRESHSPYASPICLVRKVNGDLRLTVDYRKLNKLTVKDAYELPKIEESFTRLSGSKWYSTMDLRSGYYQIQMHPDDCHKTAFVCPFGFFEWTRLPQGVSNAPATFQRMIEKCMGDINLREVLAFIDDLIVFSETLEDHKDALEVVFQRLRQFGLKLSIDKCKFFRKSVKYLGHIVSENGVATDPGKISVIKEWPVPINMKQLRSYLGFVGYFRRFIQNFSKIAAPLHKLLKGYTYAKPGQGLRVDHALTRKPFGNLWSTNCQEAFEKLKDRLVHAPVLAIANFDKPFELHTDASHDGLGAVLYQHVSGKLHPVAFASRSLSTSERNYPAHKLEYLALKWAVCEKFHDYLYGSRFHVVTDNNPLTYVMTTAKLDATGHRWLAALSMYDFDISYRAGVHNQDADALSRIPRDVVATDSEDEICKKRIKDFLFRAHPKCEVNASVITSAVMAARDIPYVESLAITSAPIQDMCELDEEVQQLRGMSTQELISAQEGDPDVTTIKRRVQMGINIPHKESRHNDSEAVQKMMKHYKTLFLQDGLLFRKSVIAGKSAHQLVVPTSLREKALSGLHDEIGHLGSDRSISLATLRFYWPNMRNDIVDHCHKCKSCLMRKHSAVRAAPMGTLTSKGPMDLCCVDFLSLETDKHGISDVLVITDHFTCFAKAFPTRSQKSKQVADVLWKGFFLDFGFPRRIHSDRGGSFTSKLIKDLEKIAGITQSLTTPYHPQGNGQVERFNRSLLDMLGTLDDEKKASWSRQIKYLAHAYNCTKNDATGYSPYELMFNRQPRLPVDCYFGLKGETPQFESQHQYVQEMQKALQQAYKIANDNALKSVSRNKKRYDAKVRTGGPLKAGDRVLVRNVGLRGKQKLANIWSPDVYVVTEQLGDEGSPVYSVRREDGKGPVRTLHRNLLLPCGFLPITGPGKYVRSRKDNNKRKTRLKTLFDDVIHPRTSIVQESSSDSSMPPYNRYHLRCARCPGPDESEGEVADTEDPPSSEDCDPAPRPQRLRQTPSRLTYYELGKNL